MGGLSRGLVINVQYFDWGAAFTDAGIYQKSLNWTIKSVHFIAG